MSESLIEYEPVPTWQCPKCGGAFEFGETAFRMFDPTSPAFCPDCEDAVELELYGEEKEVPMSEASIEARMSLLGTLERAGRMIRALRASAVAGALPPEPEEVAGILEEIQQQREALEGGGE